MKHLIFIVFLLLGTQIAQTAQARCSGIDYRDHLGDSWDTALQDRVSKVPFAYGNHWVATKGDKQINVIGTMHGGDRRMGRIMRGLRPVVEQADAILFEVTRRDLTNLDEQFKNHADLMLLPRGQRLESYISAESWEMLVRLAAHLGMKPANLNRMQPWAASFFLIWDGCQSLGLVTGKGLDDRLERHARKHRVPIGSLEIPTTGFKALSRIGLRDQARMLEFELQMFLTEKPDNATPVEAYFDEAVWEAMLMNRLLMYSYLDAPRAEIDRQWDLFERYMLDERNKLWMEPMLAAKGNRIVVAVGAAHLPGQHGVLNLLKQRGYTLERAEW
ncbi:MAG: TraB/GumN family protein [Rhodobacteraceae bacterium]|nr:TraB/GumN family protein [Paracoccaceae bacterium]